MYALTRPLTLSKADAAFRQVEAAILSFREGDFDLAITLAGAAEGMIVNGGGHDFFSQMRDHPKASEHFDKKYWISVLNVERDWLKHPTEHLPDTWEFNYRDAAFMIARALSKLTQTSPRVQEFAEWYLEEMAKIREEKEAPGQR